MDEPRLSAQAWQPQDELGLSYPAVRPDAPGHTQLRNRTCRHQRWLLPLASSWFVGAGIWLALTGLGSMSGPWAYATQVTLGFAALALGTSVAFDSWLEARAARKLLEQHLEMMLLFAREREALRRKSGQEPKAPN